MQKLLMCFILAAVLYPLKASAQYNQQDPAVAPAAALTPDASLPPVTPAYLWQAASSLTYASGDFGTSDRADIFYLPVTISRYFSKASLEWTIPYVYKRNGPDITFIDGRPFRTSKSASRNANGLGDMLFKGTFHVIQEDTQPLTFNLVGQIEAPTADDSKGLGTGEFDETIGAHLSKSEKGWTVFADIYYTNTGSPSGVDLKNQLAFDIGGAYSFENQMQVHLYYEKITALVSDVSDAKTIFLGCDYQLQPAIDISGDLGFGLTEGSPEISVRLGAGVKF